MRTCIRVRPLVPRPSRYGDEIEALDLHYDGSGVEFEDGRYSADSVFGGGSSQEEIFNFAVVPLVE